MQEHYRTMEKDVLSALEAATGTRQAVLGALGCMARGLECEIVALWEPDATGRALCCTALWSSKSIGAGPFAQTMRVDSFGRGQGLPGRTWADAEPVWVAGLDHVTDSPRAAAAAAEGLRTAVALPVRAAGEVVGVIEFFSPNDAAESRDLTAVGAALAGRVGDALARHRAQEALRAANRTLERRVRERTCELERTIAGLDAAQIETVRRLCQAVEFRDQDTGTHVARVSAFAARVARRAGLDADRCVLIERATPLHDVGKVAIPDSVLLKPGALTPDERALMETHAEIGHRLLDGSQSPVLQLAASIALTHHERYDGSGYPRGLAGEHIPIEGRIVAIADVFDALTSDRPYRPAMTVAQALDILRAGRGTHFDPFLLDQFEADLNRSTRLRAAGSRGM
jgi:response regulator RpfG family c-di-GMP phosphodiesterase